jgi:predicted ATPase
MLTRVQIDGFKTFEGFQMDLGPLLFILGPNAAGKSNFFDALHLLSRLAWTEVGAAFSKVRGEPLELFRRQPAGRPGERIRFVADVLVQPRLRDPFGKLVKLTHTRMRYEVVVQRKQTGGMERLFVVYEKAESIPEQTDRWRPGGRVPSRAFRRAFLKYGSPVTWLETVEKKGKQRVLRVPGEPDQPAGEAEATYLSTVATARHHPQLFALREELRSWRFLQLVPAALHQPSFISDPDQLEPSGSNLAKVLARIETETATDVRRRGELADLVADLVALVPGVADVQVIREEPDARYRIDVTMKEGSPYSSRVVSDGTLRILALLAVLYDPKQRGLICLEEPENGIHPGRLKAVIRRLRALVSNPDTEQVDAKQPLAQMVVSSHSPVVLASVPPEDVVFFDVVSVARPESRLASTRTRVRRLLPAGDGPLAEDNGHQYVTRHEVTRYLSSARQEE